MVQYFDSIKQRILDNVPDVQTVELWNNQITAAEVGEQIGIVTPAVYLGFNGDVEYTGRNETGEQLATFQLRVYIVIQNLVDNTNNDGATDWRILTFKQLIYKALNNFTPTNGKSELIRVSEEMDEDHGGLNTWIQNYSGSLIDSDNKPETTELTIEACFTADLKIDNDIIRTGVIDGGS